MSCQCTLGFHQSMSRTHSYTHTPKHPHALRHIHPYTLSESQWQKCQRNNTLTAFGLVIWQEHAHTHADTHMHSWVEGIYVSAQQWPLSLCSHPFHILSLSCFEANTDTNTRLPTAVMFWCVNPTLWILPCISWRCWTKQLKIDASYIEKG